MHGLTPTLLEGLEDHTMLAAHQQQDIKSRHNLPSLSQPSHRWNALFL